MVPGFSIFRVLKSFLIEKQKTPKFLFFFGLLPMGMVAPNLKECK